MTRSFKLDPFLKNVMDQFVEKKYSISSLIMFFPTIKELYVINRKRCTEDVEISSDIRDFAFSSIRWEAEAKCLMRAVITFDATISTAAQVPQVKGPRSTEGASCIELMTDLDDEMCLSLGMMGDAALEIDKFTCARDDADMDEAKLQEECGRTAMILDKLFVEGQCLEIPGLTQVMLRTLRRPRTYMLQGTPKTIRSSTGPSPDLVTRCLKRMAGLVAIIRVIMFAEFPWWEILSSMRAFSLRACSLSKTIQAEQHVNQEVNTCLEKIALAVRLTSSTLLSQYHHFSPLAQNIKRLRSCDNFEAWSTPVIQTQQKKAVSCRHESNILLEALIQYGCWQGSSTSVECAFKTTLSLKGGQCDDTHISRETDIIFLQLDACDENMLKTIYQMAGKLWMKWYGRTRQTLRPRFHKGFSQAPRGGEAGFKRQHHAMTESLLDGTTNPQCDTFYNLDNLDLNQKQLDEYLFNEQKASLSKVESLLSGHLLDNEISPALIEQANLHLGHITRRQHDLELVKQRRRITYTKNAHDLTNYKVWFAEGCHLGDSPMRKLSTSFKISTIYERSKADLYIVSDPAACSAKVHFIAGLLGSIIATQEFLMSHGKRGVALQYKAAMIVPRAIYITCGFMHLNSSVSDDLIEVLEQPKCKWHLYPTIGSIQTYLTDKAEVRKRRQRKVLVFAMRKEKATSTRPGDQLHGIKNVVTYQDSFGHPFINCLDETRCQSGVCSNY